MSIHPLVQRSTAAPHHVVECSPDDAQLVLEHLPAIVEREQPDAKRHARLDRLTEKPWGAELRAYVDRWIDVWRLAIFPGMATSLHAHVRKDTYLICLGGTGALSTVAGGEIALVEGVVVLLRAGVVHQTRTDEGVDLLEIELPRDKLDLVRIEDRYGREDDPYEETCVEPPETGPLVPQPLGPPDARLRRRCQTGAFEFGLETGREIGLRPEGLVVAISLATSSVLRRQLAIVGLDTLGAIALAEPHLAVRRARA